jgi:DNA-binding PadR family transcriptional regulator
MKSSPVGSLSPEYVFLGLLSQGPAHGYQLHQVLTLELGQIWHLSQSQVYSILNRLERKGYIQSDLQEQEKLPAKRLLSLTDAGREYFLVWLRSPNRSSVREIRVEFTTRLYFANSISQQLAHELIDDQIAKIQKDLKRLENLQAKLPADQVYNHLGLDLRLRQLNSIQAWLAGCHQAVDQHMFGDQGL